jgi:hypothetical protein
MAKVDDTGIVAAKTNDPVMIPLTPKKVVLYIFPKNFYNPTSYLFIIEKI